MLDAAIITVEKLNNGNWFARFAESDRFYGEAERLGSATKRLITSFGREKIERELLAEVEAAKRHDFRAFRVPLNEIGQNSLRGNNPYAASRWSPSERIFQFIAHPVANPFDEAQEGDLCEPLPRSS